MTQGTPGKTDVWRSAVIGNWADFPPTYAKTVMQIAT